MSTEKKKKVTPKAVKVTKAAKPSAKKIAKKAPVKKAAVKQSVAKKMAPKKAAPKVKRSRSALDGGNTGPREKVL